MRVTRQEILDAAREAAANYAKILELVEAIAPQAPPGTISDKVKNKLKPFLDMIALFATAPGS
jgi:hypothetical protein